MKPGDAGAVWFVSMAQYPLCFSAESDTASPAAETSLPTPAVVLQAASSPTMKRAASAVAADDRVVAMMILLPGMHTATGPPEWRVALVWWSRSAVSRRPRV